LKDEDENDRIVAPILAGAYVDFRKKISAYTAYKVQSNVGSWDNKFCTL
jgi:hypothetical protein